ncbi:unnamed protein product [Rangifer tarandus platyrhynchus]|uniref:Uncharacterized protein n=1 Tax=Rangifer tarandus platyrhynchus TaxID=3082113 RepID=A0AC59Z599_RANTA
MEFSRQEYWSGLPFPSPGHLPNARAEPRSPTPQVDSLPSVVQSLSRAQLFVTPMDYSTRDFPVLHHLLELAQTHVHRVCDAIQPSCLLSSPSPPAINLSQHQGLF